MRSRRTAAKLLAPIAGAVLLSACATTPGQYALAQRDPLEKLNRGVWAVNQGADKAIIKPVTQVYRAVAPKPVRQGVSNVFSNLSEPWSFVNNLLQGKGERAGRNMARFLINSTIGIAGLWDPASKLGARPAPEDLGQTLAVWGVNGGPYLVLPLLGPSTMRDGIGSIAAAYVDPVKYTINHADINVWYKRGYLALYVIDTRSQLIESGGDAFLESSLDPYAAARSAYLQLRTAEIADQDDQGGVAPAANGVPAPGGSAPTTAAPLPGDDQPAAPGAPLPQSSAPLPGDDAAPAQPAAPQTSPPTAPLPQSAAPLPGDDAPATPKA